MIPAVESAKAMSWVRRVVGHLAEKGDIWLACAVVAVALPVIYFVREPAFVNLTSFDSTNDPRTAAMNMAIEANKYLVSLTTLLTGSLAVGARLSQRRWRSSLAAMFVALATALVFGFLTFARLTTELSQRQLALDPNSSLVLFYLEMEFWCFLAATFCIAFTLLFSRPHGADKP